MPKDHVIYSAPDTKKAIVDFKEKFMPIPTDAPHKVSFRDIASEFHLSYRNVWRILGSGRIPRMGLVPATPLFHAMRFVRTDVVAALVGNPNALTSGQAAKRMGIHPDAMRTLVLIGQMPKLAIPPEFESGLEFMIDPAAIDQFLSVQISSKSAYHLLRTKRFCPRLKALGLQPTIEIPSTLARTAPTVFFDRRLVEQIAAKD